MSPYATLQDEIDFVTSSEHVSPFSKHVLVFYVCGNPGLIEYYRNYLKFLTTDLSGDESDAASHNHQIQYHVHGESLPGFEHSHGDSSQPYSLDEIKGLLSYRIEKRAKKITEEYDLKQSKLPVILIGHSIGTWLILESIAKARQSNGTDAVTVSKCRVAQTSGGILLFPTIVDIAKSPNGLRLGWLLRLPQPELLIAAAAQLLFLFVPLLVVTALLQIILQMSYHSALVTATFLKTPKHVRQALHMARCEFLQVTDDIWDDGLWGLQDSKLSLKEAKALAKDTLRAPVKLYFFWGQNDHWVANKTRDMIIASRGQTKEQPMQPLMEIDHHGLPHAFAVHDRGAQIVAKKTAYWIRDIVRTL